jgi:putative ABC transport system permease protein
MPTGVAGPGRTPITRTYPDQGHGSVGVTAIPGDTKMSTPPDTMLEGRWLNAGETGAIVLNQAARANTVSDVHAGDTVQLSVGGKYTTWRVVGIAQERQGSGAAYVTAEGLTTAIGKPRTNRLRITTGQHDEQTRTAVAAAVEKRLTEASVPVRSAASVGQAEAAGEGHLSPLVAVVLIVAVAMAAVGCIGLASTMSTNVLERTREFGVMHAIGALPKAVRRIVVAEGVFIAVASCLLAIIPTVGLTLAMGAGLGNAFMYTPLPFRISVPAVGIWIVLVVAGAVLATRAAATRASRVTVREALAYV